MQLSYEVQFEAFKFSRRTQYELNCTLKAFLTRKRPQKKTETTRCYGYRAYSRKLIYLSFSTIKAAFHNSIANSANLQYSLPKYFGTCFLADEVVECVAGSVIPVKPIRRTHTTGRKSANRHWK